MPWRHPISLNFSRIQIAAQVPSESGVYALSDGDCCIFLGESWNLKGRLLELANVLANIDHLTITFELCPEADRIARRDALASKLLNEPSPSLPSLPGLTLSRMAQR